MSSLAAARADNMYYPPEWRPEMGGISKFQGSKGANQYEQYGKIRFELPVHGWCLGCGRHIGRGTRFNATKDQVGMYYTTKIWQFSMKCPSCSTVLIIKTDPKNTDYEYVEGIRKKDMAFDPEEAGTQRVQDSEVSNQLAVDPLYRLEHEQADKRRAASRKTVLTRLTELSDAHGRDDYSANAALRQAMRSRKKKDQEREEEAKARGLGIRLATPSPADAHAAQGVKYRSRHKGFRNGERAKMASILSESIFGAGKESAAQARQKAVLTKAAKLGIKTRGMRLLEPGVATAPSASSSKLDLHSSSLSPGIGGHHASVSLPHKTSKKRRRADDTHRDVGGIDFSSSEVDQLSHFQADAGTAHVLANGNTSLHAPSTGKKHDHRERSETDEKQTTGDGKAKRQKTGCVVATPSRSRTKEQAGLAVGSTSSREKKRHRAKSSSSKGSASNASAVGGGGLAAIATLY